MTVSDEEQYRITSKGRAVLEEVRRRAAAGDTRRESAILNDILGEICEARWQEALRQRYE